MRQKAARRSILRRFGHPSEAQPRPRGCHGSLWDCPQCRAEVGRGLSKGAPTVGGGFCSVIMSTFMGGYFAKGACPCASSRSVMPRDLRAEKRC